MFKYKVGQEVWLVTVSYTNSYGDGINHHYKYHPHIKVAKEKITDIWKSELSTTYRLGSSKVTTLVTNDGNYHSRIFRTAFFANRYMQKMMKHYKQKESDTYLAEIKARMHERERDEETTSTVPGKTC